jgi:hypothetical protein
MSDRIDPSYAGCPDIRRLSRWIIHENPPTGNSWLRDAQIILMSWRIVTCLTHAHSGAPNHFKVSSKTKLFSQRESSGMHLWFPQV